MGISKEKPSEKQAARSILIVDDHPIVRRGIRHLLEEEMGLSDCMEASNAGEAQELIEEHTPDIALIDLSMEGMSGIELIKSLRSSHPNLPILVVSMRDETIYAVNAIRAGANGFIMKQSKDSELIAAVNEILAGGQYMSERVQRKVAERSNQINNRDSGAVVEELSDREMDVFARIGMGFAPRHIADDLCISVKTVETHRRNIRKKLGISSASELARFAVQWQKDASRLN